MSLFYSRRIAMSTTPGPTQFMLADMAMQVHGAWLIVHYCARQYDAGFTRKTFEASMAEERERVIEPGIELAHALAELLLDLEWVVAFLDVKARLEHVEERQVWRRLSVGDIAVSSYGTYAGILSAMKTQKVTVHIDSDLLRRAQERTGEGVTGTIRQGLELVAATEAYERLRALRGKVKFSVGLKELREDRH